ncbi:MAG: transposase [Desulfobacteraceae bacterium]|nr:transposase [Desulfobacteraceae bacterium]
MPRKARIIVPDCPHHIVQRGHNRQVVFASDTDYQFYLDNLQEWKETLGCRVYAFCLMTNHVHLILNPGKDVTSLAKLMKRVNGRQTRYVNKKEKRTGSLWEGRYKSSPVSTREYLLACSRYVELNPVRAGMVADPTMYPWSSYRSKVGMRRLNWLDDDPVYMELADSRKDREKQYEQWVKGAIPQGEWELIRQSLQRGQLTGSRMFINQIEEKLNRRVEFRGPGRPKKKRD